ncbi:MAG: divalent-cation tolerance protein CutA [Kiritimatiellae bacterium]|nr:divalent-cation tolerance protein CutA [Kiritimatiellia bacterium]
MSDDEVAMEPRRSEKLAAVYMTAASREEAQRIARALVEERLAACVNILGACESVYRWKGAVEEGQEVAMLAKTRRSAVERLIARVRELHSYEVPCAVAFSIKRGNPDFLGWISESVE